MAIAAGCSKLLQALGILFFSFSYHSCCCNGQENETDIKTVYIVLMVPYPDPLGRPSFTADYDDGHDITPAAYLAVEQINNRTDILEGYKLDLIRSDGGCTVEGRTVYSFAKDIIYRPVPIAGIIGPSCDTSSQIIAKLTSSDRASLVTLPYFGYLEQPNTFGILGSASAYGKVYFSLISKNNWREVALLHSPLLSQTSLELLRERLENDTNYGIAYMAQINKDYLPLQDIRTSFLRIIITNTSPELSSRLLCLAYCQNMIFPSYQWIFSGILDSDFHGTNFTYDGKLYNCSKEEINIALEGSLSIFYTLSPESNTTCTFSGLNYPQYLDEFNTQIQEYKSRHNVNSTPTDWANVVYDATWALALAVNFSLGDLEHANITFTKDNLGRQRDITEIIQRHMFDVDFQGITRHIKFERQTFLQDENFYLSRFDSNGIGERIGVFKSGKLYISSVNTTFIDYKFKERYEQLNVGIAVLFLTLVVVALALAIPAQIMNVVCRKHRSIKATSHRLNHIIFIGCYLLILGIVAHTLRMTLIFSIPAQTVLCNIFPCSCSIGITLILATVYVKTWRLYDIFTTNGRPNKCSWLNDKTLVIIIGILLIIELSTDAVWMTVDPQKAIRKTQLKDFDGSIPILVTNTQCQSDWLWVFVLMLSTYKCLLLFLSLVFAFLTHHITIKEFKTKNIIVLVYLLSVLSAFGLPVYLIVRLKSQDLTLHFLILITCLCTAVYVCLVVLFLPPIIVIIKEKYQTYGQRLPSQLSNPVFTPTFTKNKITNC